MKRDILGITVRYEDYQDAHVNVLKVNKVHTGGPAFECGLQPEVDFILGGKSAQVEGGSSLESESLIPEALTTQTNSLKICKQVS